MAIVDAGFTDPELNADICKFKLALPKFTLGFKIPTFKFPPDLPIPKLNFELSCDPTHPISVSADVEYGGGRIPIFNTDPDDDEGQEQR